VASRFSPTRKQLRRMCQKVQRLLSEVQALGEEPKQVPLGK
jgi:uncharacterized protein (UPF0335 family)